MPSRQAESLVRNVCKLCGKVTSGKHKRKYCSSECSEEALGGADRHMGRMERDPTPEQIAEMCRQMRDGELVVGQGVGTKASRQKPSWVVSKKIR